MARGWVVVSDAMLSGEALEPYADGVGSPGFLDTVKPHAPGQKKLAVHSGEIWVALFEHTNGASHAAFFPGDEFVYVLEGTVTLPDDRTGNAPTFSPGEHFLVPKGWQGTWTSEGFFREIAVCSKDWLSAYDRTLVDGTFDARRRDTVLTIDPAQARDRLEAPGKGGWPRSAHIQGSDLLVRLVAGAGDSPARVILDQADTFVQVIDGAISLVAADGGRQTFGEGEFVVVPRAFSGSCEVEPEFVGVAVTAGVRA
jgi:uncharacterized cupin superfamily protein